MLKKCLALLCVASMVLGFSFNAFADEVENKEPVKEISLADSLWTVHFSSLPGAKGATYYEHDIKELDDWEEDYDVWFKPDEEHKNAPKIFYCREIGALKTTTIASYSELWAKKDTYKKGNYSSYSIVPSVGFVPEYGTWSWIWVNEQYGKVVIGRDYVFADGEDIIDFALSYDVDEIKIGETGYGIYVPKGYELSNVIEGSDKVICVKYPEEYSISNFIVTVCNDEYVDNVASELVKVYENADNVEKLKVVADGGWKFEDLYAYGKEQHKGEVSGMNEMTTIDDEKLKYIHLSNEQKDKEPFVSTSYVDIGGEYLQFGFKDTEDHYNKTSHIILQSIHKVNE